MSQPPSISPAVTARPTTSSGAHVSLTPEQFARMRDLLAEYGGIYLDAAQRRVLEAGVGQRMAATGRNLETYERHIRSAAGRDELRLLSELVLNHETFFFRNVPHLRALREVLLPELHRRKPAGLPIRLWSAGCATGEEAYSLAITALEALGGTARPIQIIGTDLSEAALQRARAGYYRGRALNNLPPELLARYFQPQGDGYVVGDAPRALVRFHQLNLLEPFPEHLQRVDAIFCQNVTIYFQDATRRQLMERFHALLPAGGLLFLGFSETLWNVFDGFRSREVAGAYVYYKESSNEQPAQPPRLSAPPARPPERTDKSRPTPRSAAGHGRPPAPARPAARSAAADREALRLGRELLDRGQTDEAFEALRQIAPGSAFAPQAMNLAARAHADRGDLDLAIAEVRRVLEEDPLNDEAYLLLGVIYMRQSQWQLAIQQLERARYLQPDAALVSFHLATAYRQTGRADLAAREYRSTLSKLRAHPPDSLLDGVAVAWLRETCQRQLETLPRIS